MLFVSVEQTGEGARGARPEAGMMSIGGRLRTPYSVGNTSFEGLDGTVLRYSLGYFPNDGTQEVSVPIRFSLNGRSADASNGPKLVLKAVIDDVDGRGIFRKLTFDVANKRFPDGTEINVTTPQRPLVSWPLASATNDCLFVDALKPKSRNIVHRIEQALSSCAKVDPNYGLTQLMMRNVAVATDAAVENVRNVVRDAAGDAIRPLGL